MSLNKGNVLTMQQFCCNVIITWYETLNKDNLLTVQQFSTVLVKVFLWMSNKILAQGELKVLSNSIGLMEQCVMLVFF